MSDKINAAVIAILIYDYLKDHPEKKFERKDFISEETDIEFFKGNDFSEKNVRTAFNNILKTGKVQKSYGGKKSNKKTWYQYSVIDDSDQAMKEIRTALIYSINRKQFKDLHFGTADEPENIHLAESGLQADWMAYGTKYLHTAESQRIHLDTRMLDNLIHLISHAKDRHWSKIYLLDENEVRKDEPMVMAFVKIIMQDRQFHCIGVIKTDTGFTGNKVFLEEIDSVEKAGLLIKTKDYVTLEKMLIEKLTEVPGFFTG